MGAGVESPRHRALGDVCKGWYLRRSALVRVVRGLDGESGGAASYAPEQEGWKGKPRLCCWRGGL